MAFEVKITVRSTTHDFVVVTPITIASFDKWMPKTNRRDAITFAKAIDPGFAVEVIDTENEDNREMAFGLIYSRDADLR